MAKEGIKVVLATRRTIRGKELPAGYVILEGTTADGLSADDVSKALQLGEIKVIGPETKAEAKKKDDK
ncbi:MAG: hypothetical protein HZB36_02450 [Candidatus Omnitrophica bacterium]|nr:hypothetical protein [Candidatus Omnitrophota bacterium]